MKIYGPVPSRRLGNSLGINNIPHKICSYSCKYCQIGKTREIQIERQEFYNPGELVDQVNAILCSITDNSQYPDYLSIVPDGEPTLDINLGKLIDQLKVFKIPVAVFTNASLINLPEVQNDLQKADYVSVKTDAFITESWKKINVPHKELKLNDIACGISSFLREYNGKFVTETMLVQGINDSYDDLETTAKYIETFEPHTAYISVPTRPTAYNEMKVPDEAVIHDAWQIFKERIDNVELLTQYEGNKFSHSGNSRTDLLSITSVHPMREDAVYELLEKNNESSNILDELLLQDQLQKIPYNGENFYLRRFKR